MKLTKYLENRSRFFLVLTCLGLSLAVGVVDYLTGYEILFSVFYLIAVGIGAWNLGKGFGLFVSVLSVAFWIIGDVSAGAHYSSSFVPIWNALILLIFYAVVVWLLSSLKSFQEDLEDKVRQRTTALTQQIAERSRLQKEILEISEREQRRIGHDLHDSLCQHLTATALAGRVLGEKLAAGSLAEAADADQIVQLIQDGIELARNLAHGIAPVEMEDEGLMAAFEELVSSIEKNSKIHCVFACETPVLIQDATSATHLYRIAQEAVSNAIRHGQPGQILISLTQSAERIKLCVEDDGVGLPENWQKSPGFGTRIMAYRAAMMNASISIEPNPTGGTLVECSLPMAAAGLKQDDKP